MDNFQLKTPVAFIIFNRPDTTERVFQEIRKARPPKLLVIADGARPGRPGEEEKCAVTRSIIDQVDWDCQVLTEFSEKNLGCGVRISSGLNWVFENVEEAIVLEDDCLPNPTFFRFCQELLDYYRHDERVMMVGGTNLLGEWKSDRQNYHFSYYGGIWGWATWRRAWKYFDFAMKLWEKEEIRQRVRDVLADPVQYQARKKIYDQTYSGQRVTWWAYQWGFARLIQSGLSIVPAKNLISNIGFRADSTHTVGEDSAMADIPNHDMSFPLTINEFTAVDRDYDREFFNKDGVPGLLPRALRKINRMLGLK